MSSFRTFTRIMCIGLATLLLTVPITGSAWADPPPGRGRGGAHGHGNQGNQGNHQGGDRRPQPPDGAFRFGDSDWSAVRNYYEPMIARGHCPPGLAKRNNGCMPPGQARRWAMGRPLPAGVWVPVEPAIISLLRPLPSGYRYVRVDSDILAIAVGTSMVVDAITNLGSR